MVSTRGKKKAESANTTLEENETSVNALVKTQTTDSVIVNVEEPNADAQFEHNVEIAVVEARNEENEGKPDKEEHEKLTQVENDGEKTIAAEMDGDSEAEIEENTFEDDEIDDQENVIWEDDDVNSEYDDEEDVVDEDEGSEEEDDGEDLVSEEEEAEEEGDEEDNQEEKETAKGDGGETEVKEDEKHETKKAEGSLKNIEKSSERSRKKKVGAERSKKVEPRDKPESSKKRKVKKRVESMGMIFMCSSKTKNDCYQYRILGLPESKKNVVEKIYKGMRLFLYDVDQKLMYGIYKAVEPGGYNIEPKAFKSQFPSQVRFTVLEDCLPLAEEKFKKVIKDNYFTNTKFNCLLNSEQVKKLCKLFIASSKGRLPKKLGGTRVVEKRRPIRKERTRKQRAGDKRRLELREDLHHHERPCKRPRRIISPLPRPRKVISPLPALPPPTVPSYVYERTSDAVAYRRDLYLESHSPYRDRHDPLVNSRDLHRDGRDSHYRDGRDSYPDRYRNRRDPYVERRDPYRDGHDPYPKHRDPYRDGRDPYPERGDLYRDGRDPYPERRDPYRDGRDPYPERRNPYRDGRDSYLNHCDLYRDGRDPYVESRDSLRDSYLELRGAYRDVYREERGGAEYRDSYRRDELLERRDIYPVSLGTRHRDDIGSRDTYVSSYRERPSYAEPIYSEDYPSRAGFARHYRL